MEDAKDDPEVLHFVIKVYPDGEFTSLLASTFEKQSVVDVNISSPRGLFDPFVFLHGVGVLVMLAAGSGLTPMLEVIRFLRDRRRSFPVSNVTLMFFCNNPEEIICKSELDQCSEAFREWFRVTYVLSKAPNDSELSNVCEFTGRVSSDLLQKYFEKYPVNVSGEWSLAKTLICGSHGFNSAAKQYAKIIIVLNVLNLLNYLIVHRSLCSQKTLAVDSTSGIFVF